MTTAFCEWCGEPFPAEEGTYLGCCRKCRHPALQREPEYWNGLGLMWGSEFNMVVWILLFGLLWWSPLLDFLSIGVVLSAVIYILWFAINIMGEA